MMRYMKSENRSGEQPAFWYATYFAKGFRHITQAELNLDFRDEFLVSEGETWKPPSHRIIGKGRWPDWMAFEVPVISERSLECLGDLLASCVDVVPWFREGSHAYFLLRIKARIPRSEWSCEKISMSGDIIAAADVISVRSNNLPHMFYLDGYLGKDFVSDVLAQRSYAANLGGALFVDPCVPEMHLAFIPPKVSAAGSAFIRREEDIEENI
jgi:hypothetical protein